MVGGWKDGSPPLPKTAGASSKTAGMTDGGYCEDRREFGGIPLVVFHDGYLPQTRRYDTRRIKGGLEVYLVYYLKVRILKIHCTLQA